MKLKRILTATAASALLLASCHTETLHHAYLHVSPQGWDKTDTLHFAPDTLFPTTHRYHYHIGIRHDDSYPYRDLWLTVGNDSVHIYLADEEGNWKGNGIGEMRQLEIPVRLNCLTDSTTQMDVTHLMQHNPLPGLHDIGLRIEEHR